MKALGPSYNQAWALQDSISVIAEPLCFLINAFLNEGKFPMILNKLMFVQSSKRVILKIQTTIDLFLFQQLLQRFSKKAFLNKLPTILITTNFFPGTIWFQEKYIHDGCTGFHNWKKKKGN